MRSKPYPDVADIGRASGTEPCSPWAGSQGGVSRIKDGLPVRGGGSRAFPRAGFFEKSVKRVENPAPAAHPPHRKEGQARPAKDHTDAHPDNVDGVAHGMGPCVAHNPF